MFRAAAVVTAAALALVAAPVHARAESPHAVDSAYRSCSYPKSNVKVTPKRNSVGWRQQGFTTQLRGIDVSGWQHPRTAKYPMGKPIDFARVKQKYSIAFAIIKASDGRNADKGRARYLFRKDRAQARKLGIIVGAYHYAVPGQLGKGSMKDATNRRMDAVLQARLAVRNSLGNPVGDLPLTLDFEERPCGWTWAKVGAWARDFVVEVERLTGRKPMIYANGYFINKLVAANTPGIDWSTYPLWVAMWSPSLGSTPKPVPIWGANWTFWQFSSDGKIKGVPSARTDLNVFNGTRQDLVRLANGS